MRKSILFHFSMFNTGGAEMSTLRMIKALVDRGWDVTLVLTTGGGTLESEIDPRAKIIRLRPRACGTRFTAARGSVARLRTLPDLLCYVVMRSIGTIRMIPFLFRRYEVAAVLLMGMESTFVRRVVRARNRVIWIRNDLASADPTGEVVRMLQAAAPKVDQFICVSEVSRRSLVQAVPEARGKDVVIYNILDPGAMKASAFSAPPPFPIPSADEVVILSVCRLSERAKGLRRMVRVCRTLAEAGLAFHWYVAGDGPDRALIEAEIAAQGMGERMTLLGQLDNPFPAYQAADVVAMLSNYEGLSGVINEARVLRKPVIATEVSGVGEQLTNGVNGIVVQQDESAIVAAMTGLITNKTLRRRLAAGGYPPALLDDAAKLKSMESLFLSQRAIR